MTRHKRPDVPLRHACLDLPIDGRTGPHRSPGRIPPPIGAVPCVQHDPPVPGDSAPGAAAGAVGFQIIVTLERLRGSGPRPAQNGVHRGLGRRGGLLWHGDAEQRLREGGGHNGDRIVVPGRGKSTGLMSTRTWATPQKVMAASALAHRSQEQVTSGERQRLAHFHPTFQHGRDANGCLERAEV